MARSSRSEKSRAGDLSGVWSAPILILGLKPPSRTLLKRLTITQMIGLLACSVLSGCPPVLSVKNVASLKIVNSKAARAGELPNRLDLGTIPPGSVKQVKMAVLNSGQIGIDLMRVEASCPCVHVAPLPLHIVPEAEKDISVSFDPIDEPEFRGRLVVTLRGFDSADRLVLVAEVLVEVASP